MTLVYQYMTVFLYFSLTASYLYPLQVANCDSNSRLVVDKDDNVKKGLKGLTLEPINKIIGMFTTLKLCLANALHNLKWAIINHINFVNSIPNISFRISVIFTCY